MASRLLVADDSTTIQKIVSMAFENEDMEVEGVGDGREAFDRIAEFNPDIVLADVDMPGLDGFELSTKIKETSETSGIKVLLLASDFEDFDEERYQKCGADNHISKPFKSDDIVSMVHSLLDGSSEEVGAGLEESAVADAEIIGQPAEETEAASEILSNLKVPEPTEEPSLEELLDSVEKLSLDGMDVSDFVDEGEPEEQVLEEEAPALADEVPERPEPEEQEPPEPVELPTEAELPAEDEALDLSTEELMEPPEPFEEPVAEEPVAVEAEEEAPVTQPVDDDDIMDQMIRGVEELRESVQVPDVSAEEMEVFPFEEPDAEEPEDLGFAAEPEIFAEVQSRKMDDMDELDSAFKELVTGGRPGPANHKEKHSELSSLGGIVPEPEDLLEQMAPGAFSEVGRRPATPEDIKENLDAISGFSDQDRDLDARNFPAKSWEYETGEDRFTQAIAEEVKQVLKRSLTTSLEREVSGLSDVILKTIREVVREVTPEIARRVIREEIEKIKKQDMI